MAIITENQKTKLYIGGTKVLRTYLGSTKIYSSGNTVTYCTDTGTTYAEEAEEGASCLLPKTFTPAKSGWEFAGWRQDKTASGSVLNSLAMGDAAVTLYAVFRQKVTVTYYNGSTSASSTSGYRYYNNGNVANPSFTLTQTALSGWTAGGWSTGTAGTAGITYSNGAAFTRDSNITLYGIYYQTVTLTYYNGSTSASSASGTRCYNSGSGAVANPSFTLTPASLSGWAFRGWAASSGAAAAIAYGSIAGTAFSANTTLYAKYYQTITLSYNGNGNTGGATAAQTGTRYWNTGNISNPTFTLAANGFSKTGYTFTKWALNGTSGTQYAPGAGVTLSANAAMYAVWVPTTLNVTGSSSYITTSGELGAGVWYSINQKTDTSYVNINRSGYSKATITFNIKVSNIGTNKPSYVIINGVTVLDSRSSIYPSIIETGAGYVNMTYAYTDTYTIDQIPIVTHVENYVDAGSWADIHITIGNVTLSM